MVDHTRTNDEDREVAYLLRRIDEIGIRLWGLGCDPRGHLDRAIKMAKEDGIEMGAQTISGMANAAADKALGALRENLDA